MAEDKQAKAEARREQLDQQRADAREKAAVARGFKAGSYKAKGYVSHDGIDYAPGEMVEDLTAVQVEALAEHDALEMPPSEGDKRAAQAVLDADKAAQEAEAKRAQADAERSAAEIKASQDKAAAAQKQEARKG